MAKWTVYNITMFDGGRLYASAMWMPCNVNKYSDIPHCHDLFAHARSIPPDKHVASLTRYTYF